MRLFARCQQFPGEFVFIAEQAAGDMAQRDDAGAGERGDVNYGIGIEFRRVSERVAQDEAAFGVGVENLDGLAGHGGDDIARLGGAAGGQVFAGGNDADHVQLQP